MRVRAATKERDSVHRIFTAINQIRPALYIAESCPATIEQIGILANRRIPENEAASMFEFGWLVLFAAPSQALNRLLPVDLIDGLNLAESRSGTQTILYGGKDWQTTLGFLNRQAAFYASLQAVYAPHVALAVRDRKEWRRHQADCIRDVQLVMSHGAAN